MPDVRAVEAARQAVERALPDAEEVSANVTTNPQFIDAGANFRRVTCPACGADVGDWWAQAMHHAAEQDFLSLSVVTPCCATATSLNDLHYDSPQAFARVSIHAMNPNVDALPTAVLEHVEQYLGWPLRLVWQHI